MTGDENSKELQNKKRLKSELLCFYSLVVCYSEHKITLDKLQLNSECVTTGRSDGDETCLN